MSAGLPVMSGAVQLTRTLAGDDVLVTIGADGAPGLSTNFSRTITSRSAKLAASLPATSRSLLFASDPGTV